MTTPNIVQGQIAIDPINGILFYRNNSNTLVNTTLHWSQYDSVTSSNADDILLEANLTVDGNLIINGSQTSVESTTVYIQDPIFTLGGNTAPTSDDNKDRGIEFRWHNGTSAKLGFFGFDDSIGKFTFIPDATSTSEVYSGTTGELVAKVDWSNILNKDTFVNNISGTSNEIDVSSNTGNVVLSLPATINANTTGTAASLTNARTISLSGDVTGSVSFNGSANVSITTAISPNSVALGTDTTGDFVSSLVAGNGIIVSNNSGESSTPTIQVNTSVIQAVVANVSDTEIGYLDGVTSSIQAQLNNKAPIASPTFTGTVGGITKSMVGLGNIDNTSDLNKPVSNAQQTALNLKSNINSPTFTGNVNMSVLYVDNIEIDPTGATDGKVLKFNSSLGKFVPAEDSVATAGSLNINDLADVTINSATNGQILKYNGSAWVNGADNAGTTINNLDDISDVTITSATSGEFLKWNGTAWINDAIDLATDTNGNYVQYLVAGTGITLTNGTASEGGTPTVSVTSNTYQPFDADLTAIAALSGTSGILKKTATDTWALDTATFVTTSDTGSVTSTMILNGTIVNADINSSAAIAYSKLTLTNSVVNADINSSAAIDLSKLASGTSAQIVLANSSGVPTYTTVSGDITITNTGNAQIASNTIVNADINSAAAIAYSKLSLSNTIVNADINSSAAIAYSKLNLANSITTTDLQSGAAKGGFNSTLNNQTTNYTLQASDLAKLVTIDSASNVTVTVPNILSDGDRIDILRKNLTGGVTIAGDTGVTVYGTPGLKLRDQWSGATLVKLANNTWVAMGDLKA